MSKLRIFLIMAYLLIASTSTLNADVIFEDDFESGNLDLWTVNGRQQGDNLAEVVDKYGSKMAHLYHQGYTEIDLTMENLIYYDENLSFSFDMEAQLTSGFSSTDYRYASGEAEFAFLDSGQNRLGLVSYVKATSSYIFDVTNPEPEYHLFQIPDDEGLASYATSVQDLLSHITIDEESISFVKVRFFAYGSEISDTLTSNVWIDNVSITPEPCSLLLLGSGVLLVLRKRR